MMSNYSKTELDELQEIISGKRVLSDSELLRAKHEFVGKFVGKDLPKYLLPFLKLMITNPELFQKLGQDTLVRTYSLLGFFPETFDLIYGSEVSPNLYFAQGNRGHIAIIDHPEKKIVIKPLQTKREREIALIAAELEVGPVQYESLDGFLTEKFIDGALFSDLKGTQKGSGNMYALGRRMGEILFKLHSNDIFYNDCILCDDFGRSHFIIPKSSPAILFDYGVSIRMNTHPNYSPEEIFDFVRTLPMINSLLNWAAPETIQEVVERNRSKLESSRKEQIMARDVQFIHEGLFCASIRLGNYVCMPFSKGFEDTYSS